MSPKELLKRFYESDLVNDLRLIATYFHEDCILDWNSSKGFISMNYNEIYEAFKGLNESYVSLRFEISHLLQDGDNVTVRYTSHVRTIENPDEEIPLAHYISIWEIKDNKLYRGYEVSQLADEKAIKKGSFSEIKV